jgi:autotransporter-associated beta strand protein
MNVVVGQVRLFAGRSIAALRLVTSVIAVIVISEPLAEAATLAWNPAGAGGGTGTWNTSATDWDNGGSAVAWNNANSDTASFGGTAGTVTLGEAITAGGLTFTTTGYTVTASTLTLSGTPVITADTGIDVTLASILAGSDGITKVGGGNVASIGTRIFLASAADTPAGYNGGVHTFTIADDATVVNDLTISTTIYGAGSMAKAGAGRLLLSGSNTYSGGTTINAGTLVAASDTALGTGNVTIASGATLRLAAGTTIANSLSLAGGTYGLESSEALGTVAGLIAGTSAAPASLTPSVFWSPQVVGTTYSDVLGLTNTAGTVQILEIAYDPASLGGIAPADLFLGWDDNGAWVNAIDGNSGSAGGSALVDQTGSLASLGILPAADYLGSWGRNTVNNTVWAVIDHNSDFAVIAVPEPGGIAMAGLAVGLVSAAALRRRPQPA